MTGSRSFHTTKKAQVVTSLLTGDTIEDAALKAQVCERTVYRWLEQEDFLSVLRGQEHQVLNGCSWRLVSMAKQALDALGDVLKEPAQPGAGVRVRAAVAILELNLKYLNVLSFEERLTRLESQVFNGGGK